MKYSMKSSPSILLYLLLGFFVFLGTPLFAGENALYDVQIAGRVDSLSLGQPFQIEVRFSIDAESPSVDSASDSTLVITEEELWFDTAPWPEAFRLLGDPVVMADGLQRSIRFSLAAFELGSWQIEWPDLSFASVVYQTEAATLEVHVRSSFQADSLVQAAGLQPPRDVPHALSWWLLRVAFLLALALAGYLLWRWWKRPAPSDEDVKVPKLPPWDCFLKEMHSITSSDLIEKGQVDDYYSGLSLALRGYLEDLSAQPFREMTSTELARALKSLPLSAQQCGELEALLRHNDFVKYARLRPSTMELKKVDSLYMKWVKDVRPALELDLVEKETMRDPA